MQVAVKVVNVFDGNLALGLPNHLAMILLFDANTGATTCVMDGTYITAIRTAGSAVLSARLLARKDARVATVIGAGVQGHQHLRLLPLVRDFDRINVCSLVHEDAVKLAATEPRARAVQDVEAAVRESDVICMAAHSPRPTLQAAWVRPGTHISSVGFYPPDGELPRELARNHRLFVEDRDAFEPAPVGCGELSGLDPARAATLGAVALGTVGRRNDTEITVYKAMGIGMEDLVAANLAYQEAQEAKVGGWMDW
jgi:ornithine cyclodeaminase/alanine dehydrogenase-like protein (mu-crystallin family)